jgi:DNA-binding beta-propeller fold protein YncE
MRRRTTFLTLFALVVMGLSVQAPGRGAIGDLTQKADPNDCIAETAGDCADGTGLDEAIAVAVSPDGTSVYVASRTSDAIAVFTRNPDGTLTQKADPNDCIAETAGDCANGTGLDGVNDVAISPDGTSVYATATTHSTGEGSIAVFTRNPDGTLTQKADPNDCIASTAAGGCALGTGLKDASGVAVSPDGTSVYVSAGASTTTNAIAVFTRNPDGTLTQKADPNDCFGASGPDCAHGTGLDGGTDVAVSPDGTSVYVTTFDTGGAIAVFTRNPDGTLTQKADPNDCIADLTTTGCAHGTGLDGAVGVTVSPDGTSVYVASFLDSIAVFTRNPDGTLTQKANPYDCIAETAGDCAEGTGLDEPNTVRVSPDGTSVYVGSVLSGAIAVFNRDPDGVLHQKADPNDCIADTAGDCADGTGLFGAAGVAVSPDGRSVYVASLASNAVAVFDREAPSSPPPPTPSPTISPPAATAPPTTTPADTAAPDTTITSGPDRSSSAATARKRGSGLPKTRDRTPSFSFTSTEAGSTFQCSIDGTDFTACSTPFTTPRLSKGRHTFAVRAIDAAGNIDLTHAFLEFKVKKRKH